MRVPDLVTAVVEPARDGTLKVMYVAEGSTPPDSSGYPDIDSAVAAVNEEVVDQYAAELGSRVMGFQYAWYPWGDNKPPKHADLPRKFYLMFEIRVAGSGYSATLSDNVSVTVQAATLRELADVAQAAALKQWPILEAAGIPGMMHWNRELASGQLRDVTV